MENRTGLGTNCTGSSMISVCHIKPLCDTEWGHLFKTRYCVLALESHDDWTCNGINLYCPTKLDQDMFDSSVYLSPNEMSLKQKNSECVIQITSLTPTGNKCASTTDDRVFDWWRTLCSDLMANPPWRTFRVSLKKKEHTNPQWWRVNDLASEFQIISSDNITCELKKTAYQSLVCELCVKHTLL